MTALRCERCDLAFEAEQPRCPKCLRKSTVVDANAPRRETKPKHARGLANDPGAGAMTLGAFGARWLGGAVLFFGVSFTVHGLSDLPIWARGLATALGATLLAVAWTVIAAIRNGIAREDDALEDDAD